MRILTDDEARIHLFELGNYAKFECYNKENNEKVRACTENQNSIFVYRKNSRKYGRRWQLENFISEYYLPITISQDEKWHKRIDKVIKKIESSGLWENKIDYLNNLKLLSYEDKKKITNLSWNYTFENGNKKYLHNESQKIEWEIFKIKYPFLFNENDEILSEYIYELSEIKLKSMYFGKYDNKFIKKDIREKITEGRKVNHFAHTNCYVTFEYDGDKRAWYTEEKNKYNANYLALDENTAWFCEND